MLPSLWRYLLAHFFKIFFLCLGGFVGLLLTLRLEEIAHFATLGPQFSHVLWFIIQQIPYILPIALPISSLIAAMALMQQLSQSNELTALRACGWSLRDILAPLIISALFLSALNFYIVSELATACHLNAGQLKNELRAINPLLLLNNKNVMQLKGFYFDSFGASQVGEYAENVIFLSPNKHSGRLNLLIANRLKVNGEMLQGDGVTLLVSQKTKGLGKEEALGENLVIENIGSTTLSLRDFSELLEKKFSKFNSDQMRLPELLLHIGEKQREKALGDVSLMRSFDEEISRCESEIVRRLSTALAFFTFTLMGLSFGIHIGRHASHKHTLYVIGLAGLYLVAFFAAKSFDSKLLFSSLLYLVPHLIIWLACARSLLKISRGIE